MSDSVRPHRWSNLNLINFFKWKWPLCLSEVGPEVIVMTMGCHHGLRKTKAGAERPVSSCLAAWVVTCSRKGGGMGRDSARPNRVYEEGSQGQREGWGLGGSFCFFPGDRSQLLRAVHLCIFSYVLRVNFWNWNYKIKIYADSKSVITHLPNCFLEWW